MSKSIHRPILSTVDFHSPEYRMTISRHAALYLSIPMAMTSSLPLMLRALSISCSTGRPWVSQPNRLSTWKPVEEACRVTMSCASTNGGTASRQSPVLTLMVPANK